MPSDDQRSHLQRPVQTAGKLPSESTKCTARTIITRLLHHDDRRTGIFTFLCFSSAPIGGSVASVLINAGAVGGVIEVVRRIISVSRDRSMLFLTVPLFVYSAALVVSLCANPNPEWKAVPPILTLLLFPFLYSSWCLSRKETVAAAMLKGSLVGCYGAFILAVIQFHFYDVRAEGGAGNPIVFSTVTSLAACMALVGAFIAQRRSQAVLCLGAYCAGFVAVLFSGSRTTWIAMVIATVATAWMFRDRWLSRKSPSIIAALVLALVVLIVAGVQSVPARLDDLAHDWEQITKYGNYDSSIGQRAILWEAAVSAIRESPVLGKGPQATKALASEALAKAGFNPSYTHFHNGFLIAWVEAGGIGMLALAAVFVVALLIAISTASKNQAVEARIGGAMLAVVSLTYLVQGVTGLIVGHDILDSVLMAFLAAGSYLATGTSQLPPEAQAVS